MKYLLLLGFLGLTACGSQFETVQEAVDGEDGLNSLVDVSRAEFDQCNGVLITSGLDLDRDLVLDQNEIQATSFVCDGSNGDDGQDGVNGTVLEVIDPCGDGSGADEVLLKMNNGTILAWYYGLGISVLSENVTYATTDAQKCKFEIVDGEVFEIN